MARSGWRDVVVSKLPRMQRAFIALVINSHSFPSTYVHTGVQVVTPLMLLGQLTILMEVMLMQLGRQRENHRLSKVARIKWLMLDSPYACEANLEINAQS